MSTQLSPSTGNRTQGGLYVIGKTRTGKSTFLELNILTELREGTGLCVLDAHGDLIANIRRRMPPERAKDVILLDVLDTEHPFSLNPFRCSNRNDPLAMARTISRVMQIFERLWGFGTQNSSWGPRLEQHLRNTAYVLAYHGLTMAEATLFLTDEPIRQALASSVPNDEVRRFWQSFEELKGPRSGPGFSRLQAERIESTYNKFDAFLANPLVRNIVGQETETVDWQQAMDQSKVVLVKLDAQLPDVSALLGSVIVGRMVEAAFMRTEVRTGFSIYADEFHRFATDDFATLLTETGKYGIYSVVAHQFRGQLDQKNRGATMNMANMVVFQVSGEDAAELAGNFETIPPEPIATSDRPIRAISRDPVGDLTKRPHTHETINELIDVEVAPIWRLAYVAPSPDLPGQESRVDNTIVEAVHRRSKYGRGFHDDGIYACERALVQDGIAELNRYFVGSMENRFQNQFQESRVLGAAVIALRAAIGFRPTVEQIDGGKHRTTWIRVGPLPFFLKMYFEDYVATLCLHWDSINDREQALHWRTKLKELRDMLIEWRIEDLEHNLESYALRRNVEDRQIIDRVHEETDRLEQFVESMIRIARILKREPIYSDTGLYEPMLEHPRTYSDVQDQIANELATMPRFTAKMRLMGMEFIGTMTAITDQTSPPTGMHFSANGEDRHLVEQEIRERHRQLRDEAKPSGRAAVQSPHSSGQAVVLREGHPPQIRPLSSVPVND